MGFIILVLLTAASIWVFDLLLIRKPCIIRGHVNRQEDQVTVLSVSLFGGRAVIHCDRCGEKLLLEGPAKDFP